ncbi:MAG: hypothetical protein JO287_16410 [Pseudonocardiales bacterium]|nr:hypothetical protein [Pseudonocardiales bacterium]
MINNSVTRGVVLAIIVLAAALVGICAAFLSWIGGANPPTAVLRGAAATGATIALGVTMWGFVLP